MASAARGAKAADAAMDARAKLLDCGFCFCERPQSRNSGVIDKYNAVLTAFAQSGMECMRMREQDFNGSIEYMHNCIKKLAKKRGIAIKTSMRGKKGSRCLYVMRG